MGWLMILSIATARYTCYTYFMSFNRKIEHPGVAFIVIFLMAAVMSKYGIVNGTLSVIAVFAGIGVYKFFTA